MTAVERDVGNGLAEKGKVVMPMLARARARDWSQAEDPIILGTHTCGVNAMRQQVNLPPVLRLWNATILPIIL
jgi:hypothetical protein